MTVAVLLGYLALVFGLSIWSARRSSNAEDFYLAGGKLGWFLGGATLSATHASAGTFIGTIGLVYTFGWSFAWLILSIPFAYWFLAAVLAPRFTRVKHLTLPAFLEERYGSTRVRVTAALVILLAIVVYIQAQVVAGGLIANVVFGIDPLWGMVGFTVAMIAYTTIGGMMAVVYTDLLQLVVMFFGALLALPFALSRVGGLGPLLERAAEVKPNVFAWDALPVTLLLSMGLAFTLGSISTPEKLIRLYAMKDLPTIRRGTLLAIVTTVTMNLAVLTLGLVSLVLFPDLRTGDLAMPTLASEVLPPFLGSLLLAAITAAMMSTVDSMLLVASSALSQDLWERFRPDSDPRHAAWVRRIGVACTGAAPLALLLLGVGEGELVQLIVLLFSAMMASCFFAPVVFGLFWNRANERGAMAAMVVGLIACVGWKLAGSSTVDPVIAGVFASSVAFVVGSMGGPVTGARSQSTAGG